MRCISANSLLEMSCIPIGFCSSPKSRPFATKWTRRSNLDDFQEEFVGENAEVRWALEEVELPYRIESTSTMDRLGQSANLADSVCQIA
jgi:hypothetical protein